MIKQNYVYVLLAILFLQSCAKESLDLTVQNEPVFTVGATLNGEVLNIEAGENDFYMFTENGEGSIGLAAFNSVSRFAKVSSCETDCMESFSVSFNNLSEKEVQDFFFDFDPLHGSEEYPYGLNLGGNNLEVWFEVSLQNQSISNFTDSEISWSSSQQYPLLFPLVDTFPVLGHEVSIQMTGLEGGAVACSTSYTHTISLDFADNCFIPMDFLLKEDSILEVVLDSPDDYTYEWDGNGFNESYEFLVPEDGVYCVTVTDSEDCINERCVEVYHLGQADMRFCSPAFSYRLEEVIVSSNPTEGIPPTKVVISYRDSTGMEFRSDLFEQPTPPSFLIQESSKYIPNENGQATTLIRATLNCSLFNEQGEERVLENGNIVIAVALP